MTKLIISVVLIASAILAGCATAPETVEERQTLEALRKGAKTVQGGERTAMDGPNESSVMIQAALLEADAEGSVKKRTGLLLYAANVGSAVHWVVFRTDGPELFNKYKKTVNQFLAGMKFVEIAPAPKSQPKPQPKPQPGKVRQNTPATRGGA